MPATPKPKQQASQRRHDVIAGDEVYIHHSRGPFTARVLSNGEHGCTVETNGKRHKVPWQSLLGHKRRARQEYSVVDEGEDGMLVQDRHGKRQYLAVPPEAREEKMMVKSAGAAPRVALLLKAAPARPGLAQKNITDKNGVQTKRWVRTTPEMPKARAGRHVGFENGEHKGHGRVLSAGKDGAIVQDAAGGQHAVRHDKVTHHWEGEDEPAKSPHDDAGPARPAWAPRNEGEDDKTYAKRVVDKGEDVKELPEDHGRYFNTDGAKTIPLDKLHSTKSDEENKQGGSNGPKRMLAAYHGDLGKRDPIKVMPHADKEGHYEVVDGNGTLTSAKGLGWGSLPVQEVSREDGAATMAEEKAKDLVDSAETASLPVRTVQPVKSWEELSERGPAALEEFSGILGDVAKSLGLRSDKKPKEMGPEDWSSPDGHLFLGGLKGEARAKEKVEADYGGDWSKLTDVVRGTIAVNSLDDVKKAIDAVKAAGLEFAQKPKNRFAKPTEMGYRDMLTIVKLPSGMMAELQFSTKAMSEAKRRGHKPYEVYRNLQAKHNGHEPDESWPDEDHKAFYEAVKEQHQIYGDAWKASNAKPAAAPGELKKSLQGRIILLSKRRVS